MNLLDTVAEWVQRVLAVLPPDAATFLSLPALVLVVLIGTTAFVRKLLPPLCHAAAVLVRWAVVILGALVLLPEMAIATGFRQAAARPPAALYNFGDAVASGVTALGNGAQAAAEWLSRVTRINMVVILLLAGGWIWLWNYRHCPDDASGCARPFATWLAAVSGE